MRLELSMMNKLAATASVSALALAGAAAASSEPASADPGTCGVRSQGPSLVHGVFPPVYAYYVRNRCSTARKFRIRLTGTQVTTPCSTVEGGTTRTFSASLEDPNWSIVNCG